MVQSIKGLRSSLHGQSDDAHLLRWPGKAAQVARQGLLRWPGKGCSGGPASAFTIQGPLVTAPLLTKKLGYDPAKDLAPVTLVATSPNVLVVDPKLGAKTVEEFVRIARAKPGELNYGSVGKGSASHLAMELFLRRAGIELVHVPYQGFPQVVNAMLSGQVQAAFMVPGIAMGQVRAGKVMALGVSTLGRVAALPEMPTFAEQGYPGFEAISWQAVLAPAGLDTLFRAAIDAGATRLVLCDTCGHATPDGVRSLIGTRGVLRALDVADRVAIDWHGHDDRGLALINSLVALECGVDRVHGCGLGLGERAGNAPLDLIVLNLHLAGLLDPARHDVACLVEYVERVSAATGVPIPFDYPLAGRDVFRTATGVHAAAVAKAEAGGDLELADRVYSSVPARAFGRHQEIAVGHYSGKANAAWWLRHHGYAATDAEVTRVLSAAKRADRVLTDAELHAAVSTAG